MQGGELTGPATAPEGGTITVEVSGNASEIDVSIGGPSIRYPVPADGKVTFPVPAGATGGMLVKVSIGEGLKRKLIFVEIIGSAP